MAISPAENVESGGSVDTSNADDLGNPKNLGDVLQKHAELRAGAEAVAVKRGRGRPPKNPGQVGTQKPSARPADGGGMAADLFTSDTVRPFVELPFGLAGVWFKTDAFRLEPRESDNLANQGAMVANLYAPGWNPKAVALAAFALGFAAIATRKTIQFMGELAEKKKAEKEAPK